MAQHRSVHTPVHASWLNQIEVYFSVVQRKLLTPSDFESLADLKRNVMAFQARYQRAARPFKWTFTRRDLHALLAKLKKRRAKTRKLRPAAQFEQCGGQFLKLFRPGAFTLQEAFDEEIIDCIRHDGAPSTVHAPPHLGL